MRKSSAPTLTIEKALAHMINMDYIPEGFTLEDMLLAFKEEAEVDYENGLIDRLPDEELSILKLRVEVCSSRYKLYESLSMHLQSITRKPEQNLISIVADDSGRNLLQTDSLIQWSEYQYGIGLPGCSLSTDSNLDKNIKWEGITVKFLTNNRISFSMKKGKFQSKPLSDVKLLNRKTNSPNNQALILLGLSHGKKFPSEASQTNANTTAISKLRTSLKILTGIDDDDPFKKFNENDGWKPRFALIDDRRNADERAKREAIHSTYDDGQDYGQEDDSTNKWIDENS